MCRSEMNETSMVMTSNGPGRSAGVRNRALTCSRTVTRGSVRSRQSSCPCPTSSATTWRAPRCSRTSVNPPVDAPMSSADLPSAAMLNVSSAWASLMPPRLTYGWSGVSRTMSAVSSTAVPAFTAGDPSTRTWPARISDRARSRRRQPARDEQHIKTLAHCPCWVLSAGVPRAVLRAAC